MRAFVSPLLACVVTTECRQIGIFPGVKLQRKTFCSVGVEQQAVD